MVWWEVIGWVGSGLVVLSLMQARVLRFRVLNLVGAVVATVYNTALGIWPFAAMNGAIAIIDVYWLVRLLRGRHDAATYEVVEVAPDDGYLRHVLAVHAGDIARFYPGFERPPGFVLSPALGAAASAAEPTSDRTAFLVLRGDETVGVVVVRDEGDGVGRVELDYVTPRFRDFTPGEFVYRSSGVFAAKGFRLLVAGDDVVGSHDYYARVGFEAVPGGWERSIAA
ncbi:hypothetical protein [Cellulomonas hominis]